MSPELPPELSPRRSGTLARKGRWLGRLATFLAVAVFAVSTSGWVMATYLDAKISRVLGLSGLLSGDSQGPMTILVVGSDDREGLSVHEARKLGTGTAANAASGQRSDTMMLVHISGDRKNITVVSLPRDSYVTIPAYTDSAGNKHPAQKNKLNAAFALGGAPLLIKTIKNITGMNIDHYVQVGFNGVVDTVNALGGVNVCLPYAVDDPKSGLKLPAGTSHVNGIMALAYVRARYIDPTADIGRMQRQQRFLSSMLDRATSAGVLLNPVKLESFLNAALSSIKMDQGMSRDELLDLANDLQNISPKDIRFLTVPIKNAALQTPDGEALLWDSAKAHELFQTLDADKPLVKNQKGSAVAVAPSDISVQVLNGSTVSGLAGEVSNDLQNAGYHIAASPGNADSTDTTTTVIRYDPRWDTSVKTLQAAFPDATIEKVNGLGSTFQIVVGTDYVKPVAVKVAKQDNKLDSHTAADGIC
jgi:LCP family protein required for cell wall assembly